MNEKRIKKSQVHLALHPDLMQRVRDAAAVDGRTVTNWIERAIAEKLEKMTLQ
jgi:hypothetical protein